MTGSSDPTYAFDDTCSWSTQAAPCRPVVLGLRSGEALLALAMLDLGGSMGALPGRARPPGPISAGGSPRGFAGAHRPEQPVPYGDDLALHLLAQLGEVPVWDAIAANDLGRYRLAWS